MNNIIELHNISKIYNQGSSKIRVLNNFNLKIKTSESISIFGESGSGKSTLLSICGLLDNEYHGQLIINNIITKNATETISNKIKNSLIGFIFQQYMLIPNISSRENVALPRLIARQNYQEALKDAEYLLSEVGLQDKINSLPTQLSGGEQQRVAIARSLINKPKIIIADEPTGNLDKKNSEMIFDILINQTKKNHAALILATHNINFIEKTDRKILIKENE